MLKYLFVSLLCVLCVAATAQKEENVWATGYQSGIDFNSGGPVAITSAFKSFGEGSASVCDANGRLLFYTEGSYIWDRTHQLMPSGKNLTGLPNSPTDTTISATASCSQGTVIVPMPDSGNKYYVFSLSEVELSTLAGRLYYSVVNMDLNGGLGDVEPGRKGIFLDSVLTEKMTATVGDRCNIWLLVHSLRSPASFKAFEITANGINRTPVVSAAGTMNGGLYTIGVMKVSPDRKKVVTANTSGKLELYDFDAATGIVSNAVVLSNDACYGVCFSGNSSKLYAAVYAGPMYQFDLDAPDADAIRNSRTEIGPTSFTDLKLGPDGKVYFNQGVINAPDAAGTACDVVLEQIPGVNYSIGFPNKVAVLVKEYSDTVHRVDVCFMDSVLLQANTTESWGHTWDDNSTGTSRVVHQPGSYVVTYYTPPCYFHSDTFVVSFDSYLPETGAFNGCKGNNNSFLWVHTRTADTNKYRYTWLDSTGNVLRVSVGVKEDTIFNIRPGSYFLNMANDNGCDTVFELKLSETVYYTSFQVDTVACIGDSISLNNTSAGATGYLWYFGDGGSTDVYHARHLYAQPGNYIVTLISYPCLDTVAATVTIDSLPQLYFVMDDAPKCAGTAVDFLPFYDSSISFISWDFGDGSADASSLSARHAYDDDGAYVVRATGHYRACPDTSFADSLIIYGYPAIDLGADTSSCAGQAAVVLANRVVPAAGVKGLWSTGDTAGSVEVTHPGRYWLTVSNEYGCAASDTVFVGRSCHISIPNAFTPNGDGVNDYFFPRQVLSDGVSRFLMQVYNRWGVLLFETGSVDGRGWDGRYNGVPQVEGVYIYNIEADFTGGAREKYTGNVTLMP